MGRNLLNIAKYEGPSTAKESDISKTASYKTFSFSDCFMNVDISFKKVYFISHFELEMIRKHGSLFGGPITLLNIGSDTIGKRGLRLALRVSVDCKKWQVLFNYSAYTCNGIIKLDFPIQAIR